MQLPSANLQAVKLRAIARGLGATLVTDASQGYRNNHLFQWDKFLTASVHYGTWRNKGRIVFTAFHDYKCHGNPQITVAATRPVNAIVRDVNNRFVIPAREFCRASEKAKRQSEAAQVAERNLITSYLDDLGADYAEAKKRGRHHHSMGFSACGVYFSSYNITRDNPSIELTCSQHCMRQILRLVRQDYEFHNSKQPNISLTP